MGNNTGNNKETKITLSPDATMGDKIRAARISLGMSQAELSRRTGLTSRAIRYYESNNRTPTVDAIKKYQKRLASLRIILSTMRRFRNSWKRRLSLRKRRKNTVPEERRRQSGLLRKPAPCTPGAN